MSSRAHRPALHPAVFTVQIIPAPVLATIAFAALAVTGCTPSPWPAPPETRVATVVDTLHGVAIPDDYRWLEDQDAPEVRAWIDAQNTHADRVLATADDERAWFEARLRQLVDREDVGGTRENGGFEYFTMRRVGEEAPVLYRRPAPEGGGGDGATGEGEGDEPSEPTTDQVYEVVLDPADFHPGYRVGVSLMSFSPDERLMMYSVRQGGADEIEVRIRDLETGEDLPDVLPDALYGGFDWDEDSMGFTYTHRDRYDGPRIRHHRLGTPLSEDPVLWGDGYGPETFISRNETPDGRWMIYSAQHGWARNDLFIQDLDRVRGAGPVTAASAPLRPVVEGVDAHFQVRYREGRLYILTDWEASNYRLMTARPTDPGPESWEELIPEGEHLLQSYSFMDDRIYAAYLVEMTNRVRVHGMDGTLLEELPAGPAGYSVGVSNGDEEGTLEVQLSGYLRPSRTFQLETASGEMTLLDSMEVPFDTTAMVVTREWFTSADGTRSLLHILHRADVELDGTNPTILDGYGGFNVAITPGFSTTRAAWVEAGGVWAVATLRGGREFGEDWHRDGMLTNKPNVFADFIAAGEHLVTGGWTSPAHLGISGGSNGGLLVGASMALRPDLFRAVLCTYPDLDMVRFWAFQDANNMPALLEYGDARIEEHFRVMLGYSPYQNIEDGVDYPAVMLTTGDLDTRVPPLQARKLAARLQAASASGLPVILSYDEMGGHAAGRGRPMSLRLRSTAEELAFMASQLGLELPGAEPDP
jgi:prolyl oligopeptidase